MKLKHIAVACLSALALSACQTTSLQELKPTASQETIETAKQNFADIENFSILDSGVIYYSDYLSGRYRWNRVHINELSYRYACEDLRWYVDRGMIVRLAFRGRDGATYDYDMNRCETEIPTNIYE
ncbi:hypothetical protein ACODM8_07545 [Vibrio ostreicida]|uniref:Lipoprotein n=1 Tax=Vibrio ostreicida TaxID=526588 RepID=A0ABT8BQZ8_9VIBR|nr:hypothetical protein [Vibrio ostreicida]MDN3608841.1 hypothetical protein [Vibrio ostreicida]NPD10935.1 hypothetical protein [Vibrio ostreicida]